MWLHHLWNLLGRSWSATTTGYGTTTLGFVLWVVLFTALLWFASALGTWLNLRKSGTPRPFKDVLHDSLLLGALSGASIGLIVVTSYAFFFARTAYLDHQLMVSRLAALSHGNADLTRELEIRRHSIGTSDPAFANTLYLLQAFNGYRHAMNGKPCVIMVTAPRGGNGMASMVAQFSNSVSGCSTFGPMDADIDPDVERRATDGMILNKIVFHADRNDKAAYQLWTSLGNLIQLQRSYDLPSRSERAHIYSPIAAGGQESFVWLQFGTNVQWNEQPR